MFFRAFTHLLDYVFTYFPIHDGALHGLTCDGFIHNLRSFIIITDANVVVLQISMKIKYMTNSSSGQV
jgi:hypothetical protein